MDKIMHAMEQSVSRDVPSSEALDKVRQRVRRRARLRSTAVILFSFSIFLIGASGVFLGWHHRQTHITATSEPQSAPEQFVQVDAARVGNTGEVFRVETAFGDVWATAGSADDGGYITRVDSETGSVVAEIPAVSGTDISSNASGVWIVGAASTAGEQGGTLLQLIDPATNTIAHSYDLGETHGVALAATNEGVWVAISRATDGQETELDLIDASTGATIRSLNLPDGVPTAVFPAEESAWVAQMKLNNGAYAGEWLARIVLTDASAPPLLTALSSPTLGAEGTFWGIRIDPTGISTLASLDQSSGVVTTYDEVVPQPASGGLAWDGEGVWCASEDGLTRYDPTTGNVSTISPPDGFADLATQGDTVWVLGYRGSLWSVRPEG